MKIVPLREGMHNWRQVGKKNIMHNGRSCKLLKCSECGVEVYTYGLHSVEFTDKDYRKKGKCPKCIIVSDVPDKIVITGFDEKKRKGVLRGLKKRTIHKTVIPPIGHSNGTDGAWILFDGQKIKLFRSEYEPFTLIRKKDKKKNRK